MMMMSPSPPSSSSGCVTAEDETTNGGSVVPVSSWKRMPVSTTGSNNAVSDDNPPKFCCPSVSSSSSDDGEDDGGSCLTILYHRIRLHWTSLLVSTLVFVVMVTAGMLLLMMHSKSLKKQARQDALDLAEETAQWFTNAFSRTIMPLFSLAQFAVEIPSFRALPDAIGPPLANGSLPFVVESGTDDNTNETVFSYRNLTGSPCQDPDVMARYNDIASTIQENANMPGVLLQLYMMPQAVTCLAYPLVQTWVDQKTKRQVTMNATDQLGVDLLMDPKLRYHGETTLQSNDMVIVGPITLRNCVDKDKQCHPTVKSAIVARLPVKVPDHDIVLPSTGQVVKNRWGFVVATIHWKALVQQSHMYQRFAALNCEFQLARKDRLYADDAETIVLAQSQGFLDSPTGETTDGSSVDMAIITASQEEWTIVVQYNNNKHQTGESATWISVLIVLLSFIVAGLVYVILVQKQDIMSKTKTQQARVETERNMTAYFAHELRNPISAIESALVAMPDENLPPEVKEIHDGMRLCSSFMVRIMDNLCDVRQLEEGRMTFRKTAMELDKLVMETHSMLLPSVKSGVNLQYVIHENVQRQNCVMGDYHRLLQVLTNVTSNAIKYTSKGSITLSVQWEHQHPNNKHNTVRFECVDTGPGIPPKEQAQLFKRFVRRGGAPGSGLGLAISKHIVDSMNGTIHFESNPVVAPGATCIVILPLEVCGSSPVDSTTCTDTESAAPTNTTQQQQSGLQSTTKLPQQPQQRQQPARIEEELSILIVDDILVNRSMLRKRILKCVAPNAKIEERETGEAAVELLQQQSEDTNKTAFDVIIMDQYMESVGGVLLGTDAIIAIRRMGISCLIIGSSGNDIAEEFLDAGADKVWQKPLPSNAVMIEQLRDGLGL